MLFGDALFKHKLFQSLSYEASWSNSYTFTFLAGTTVALTATMSDSIPEGTSVDIYAGETIDTLIKVLPSVKTSLLFISPVSGPANLYVKIIMKSNQTGITPVINSLGFLVEQSTSLYTIATQILSDGLLQSNSAWLVDTELQKYPIPFSWFAPVRHRYAIGKVAEAAGGVVFQDRHGVIKVHAGNYLERTSGVVNLFDIKDDRLIDASSPITEIRNRIQITTKPYVALADQVVWTLSGESTITTGEERTFDVMFTDFDAVIDPLAIKTGLCNIVSSTFYSWGAMIKIIGTGNGIFGLTVNGKPLVIKGSQMVEATDSESIRMNGEKVLSIDDNNMIQNRELAETIAKDILAIISSAMRDVDIDWRGDPTIELGDNGLINNQNGIIVSQEFNFNGALKASAKIRRIN